MRTIERLAAMGFEPGKVHVLRPYEPLGIQRLLALMKQGSTRVIRLWTAGGDRGNAFTIDVRITEMTGVQYDGGEFPINGVYKVLEPQWLETVGVRFTGEVIGTRPGITDRVTTLDAPRTVTGYLELIAVTPEPWVYEALLQLEAYRPPATGDIIVTPLHAEFE